MKNVKSIVHVALDVGDVERSLDFYVGKLGFEEMYRLDFRGRLGIIYLRVTDTQYLELFPVAPGGAAPEHNGGGQHHLCLAVDDIDAAIAEVTSHGIELIRPKSVGMDKNAQAWIADPDGNRIELMQLNPDSLAAQAIARLTKERGTEQKAVATPLA